MGLGLFADMARRQLSSSNEMRSLGRFLLAAAAKACVEKRCGLDPVRCTKNPAKSALRPRRMPAGDFTAQQAQLLFQARAVFIFQQLIIFPLYFAPGLRGLLGGDRRTKFPCSISWMIRKGAPRLCTLILWNLGWLLMMRAFLKDGDVASMSATDWARAVFMLQMYAMGFVTVVLTPI